MVYLWLCVWGGELEGEQLTVCFESPTSRQQASDFLKQIDRRHRQLESMHNTALRPLTRIGAAAQRRGQNNYQVATFALLGWHRWPDLERIDEEEAAA